MGARFDPRPVCSQHITREALRLGKHLLLYSDNVTVEDEIALKKQARAKGLLVMGPDCGTAIVNGIGLGFANTSATATLAW